MTKTWRDYFYVFLQALLFTAFLTPWHTPLPLAPPGWLAWSLMTLGLLVMLLAFLQLKSNLTPWPTPKKEGQLVTSGIFGAVRHPIYSGIFLATAGWASYQGNGYHLLWSVGLLTLFYFKSRYEEKRLQERFSDYRAYQKNTGRFFPNLF